MFTSCIFLHATATYQMNRLHTHFYAIAIKKPHSFNVFFGHIRVSPKFDSLNLLWQKHFRDLEKPKVS